VVEATVGEVGVVEGARQGTKPLAAAGEGGSRGNSLVRLGEWICGGGLDVNREAVVVGNLAHAPI
jgi:hypothetical protein